MPNHYPELFNKKRVSVQDYDMAHFLEDEAKVKKTDKTTFNVSDKFSNYWVKVFPMDYFLTTYVCNCRKET
jgi:hypothetical protein